MKRLTISLSDELFDEIDAMPNKSQFVRRLIERELGLSVGDEFVSSKTAESLNIHDSIIAQLQLKIEYFETELKRVFEAIDTTNFIVGAVDEKLDSMISQASVGVSGSGATNTTAINPVRQNVDQHLITSYQVDQLSNTGAPSLQIAGTSPFEPVKLSPIDDISNNTSDINMDARVSSAIGDSNNFDYFLKRAMIYLSLIHISEPTRLGMISYAVFCLKK